MITLYTKTGCPYCVKVLAQIDQSGLAFEEKNISDGAIGEELVRLGGKRQVPYMIDGEVSINVPRTIKKTSGNWVKSKVCVINEKNQNIYKSIKY